MNLTISFRPRLFECLKNYSREDSFSDLVAGLTVGIVVLPPAMGVTGLNALEDLYEKLRARGKHLILNGPHTQPLFAMDRAGFLDRLGRENVCAYLDAVLERAREILSGKSSRPLPPAPSTAIPESARPTAASKAGGSQ